MQELLINCLGGLSLARKSVVRLIDHFDMTSAVYCGRKTTQHNTQWINDTILQFTLMHGQVHMQMLLFGESHTNTFIFICFQGLQYV